MGEGANEPSSPRVRSPLALPVAAPLPFLLVVGSVMAASTAQKMVKLVNPQGFHARPAHMFMKLASQYQSSVEILKGNEVINGKSILDLLTLGAVNGTTLCLRAIGDDAQAAVDALSQLVESGFGEMPGQSQS